MAPACHCWGRRSALLASLRPGARHSLSCRHLGRPVLAMFGSAVSIVLAAFGGVAWGILGGALPGISPSITMALLLPLTYTVEPMTAIVMLASTYVGAEYGGSIPAI